MNYKLQVARFIALGCLAWGVTSGIPTQVNSATAQTNVSQNKQLLAQNRPTATNDFFSAKLKGCYRQGRTVRCDFLFTSKSDAVAPVHCTNYNTTKLYDYSGNSYLCSKVRVGNNTDTYDTYDRFPKGIPLKVILWFNEISESSNDFALLEIKNGGGDILKFRNVKVSR